MLFKTYIYWLSVFTVVVGLALSCPVCKACFPVTHPMDVVGLYRKQLHMYSLFRMFHDVCGIISCGLYTSVLRCSAVFTIASCGVLWCSTVFCGFQAYPLMCLSAYQCKKFRLTAQSKLVYFTCHFSQFQPLIN